jgi:hypothetical protein
MRKMERQWRLASIGWGMEIIDVVPNQQGEGSVVQ